MIVATNYSDPDLYISPLETEYRFQWSMLSPRDKALAMNYKRQLKADMKVSHDLVNAFSELCDRHPDFHIGMVP